MAHIGHPIRRLEDRRLITGRGEYAGDIRLPRLVHLAVARAEVAHALIVSVDLERAASLPGVLLAWIANDLPERARYLSNTLATAAGAHRRPVLASHQVCYVGDGIAVTVAEERYQARDSAEAVAVDWAYLPVVTEPALAVKDLGALVHEAMGTNVARHVKYEFGDIESAFSRAEVTVQQRFIAGRVCGMAMEPRTVTANFDPETGGLTVWTSTQGVFMVRDEIARLLEIDADRVRVIAHDVGGGFGPKGVVYPEEILVPLAAMHLRRPVQWSASRTEDTATTIHAHGTILDLEIAATGDGKLCGLRGSILHDMGAYASPGYDQLDNIASHLVSAYDLPALSVEGTVAFTNATPTGFIRGGARPLGILGIERMMDRLARKLAIDPSEVRRRNLIQQSGTPHDTRFPKGSSTVRYDPSDYSTLLETALAELEYDRWRTEQQTARRVLGIGLACCVESSGYGNHEPARVRVEANGFATVSIGATSQGQGHETMAALILADRLDWPLDKIRVVLGDTSKSERAAFTAASRTAIHVGNAVSAAARLARERLLDIASEKLEVASDDLVMELGVISVRGTPGRSVAAASLLDTEPLLVSAAYETNTPSSYPSSCHAAVVEVDPELGTIDILRYVIVHDSGTVINPLTFEGQLVGGYVHGLGYALFEEAIVTSEGALVTGSLVDYLIPSATDVRLEPHHRHIGTPSPFNPEGIKGVGESGTVPVAAAIANAVEDALVHYGGHGVVDRIPITPEFVCNLFGALSAR